MTRRHGILALLLAFCTIVLTACAGFPTGGRLEYGLETDAGSDDSPNVAFLPDRPQPGATPAQIVEGFINAGSGPGVSGDWARAKEFLAPSLRESWDPSASVRVDDRSLRTYDEVDEDPQFVDFSFDAVATVDDRGVYERTEMSAQTQSFRLAQQDDGEWRITEAPDGIYLDRDQFPTVFHRYPLMYFDPTYEYLVPDVRWFLVRNAATSITLALVNQPAGEWLADSVVTAFPEDVTSAPVVPVNEGVADVELSEEAVGANKVTLDRMLTQLERSLESAGVVDVEMSVNAVPLTAELVSVRSTRVPGAPLVGIGDEFGFLTGEEIEPIPGLTDAVVATAPLSVQVGRDRDLAAARLPGGEVARLSGESTEPEILDRRGGLVDPAIDPFGIVWSVPREHPTELHAYAPGTAEPRQVADAWLDATTVSAIALSRDGTRMAATVTAGGRTVLWVAGVVRDTDGVPERLGQQVQLAIVGGPGIGVTWIDDMTIGVLAGGEEQTIVLDQVVGGPTSSTVAASDAVSIAGGTGVSSLRLRAVDGTLYVRRGTTWQPTSTGVGLLATQQGSPEGR